MTLYSADVLDIAKPVPKKGKGKKNVEKAVEQVPEPTAPEAEVVEVKPPKKAPTEKQLAALAKAQESRKRKREEAEKAKQDLIDAEKQKEEKKTVMKEKRKAKKIQKLATPPPSLDEEIDRAVEELTEKEKPVVKKNDDNEPPSWFKQYVSGVKREEAKISREKKPKKQIQQEAVEVAQKNWADSFTRDRVRNEVDGHMSRMYQMMFAGRRMK